MRGGGLAAHLDAREAVQAYLTDLVYLDPPTIYHIWETLARFDNPPTYGIAQKRMDVRERKSPFNSRKTAPYVLTQLLLSARTKVILLSFSNEGFLPEAELVKMYQEKGYVLVLRHPHRRYIGAQIGIYNPAGQKVGQISHLHNEERLFIISPKKALIKALAQTLPNPSIYLALPPTSAPERSLRHHPAPFPIIPSGVRSSRITRSLTSGGFIHLRLIRF